MVECEVSGVDCSMYGSGHKDELSLGWVLDKSFENLAGEEGGIVLVVIDLIL